MEPSVVVEDLPVSEPVHPLVASAVLALEGTGVPWLLLRGAEELASPSGDVDLLVAPTAPGLLDDVLAGAGLYRLRAPGRGSHRFYSGLSEADGVWVQLDVVDTISFGRSQELSTSLAEGCLARRVRIGGVWRAAPADEAWLLVLHALLDKGPGHRADQVRALLPGLSSSDPVVRELDAQTRPGTALRLLSLLDPDRPATGPDAAAAVLVEGWSRPRRARAAVLHQARRVVRRLDLSPPGQVRPGLVVAVMGPDGAGKTTLVEALRDVLPVTSVRVHTGIWRAGRHDALAARLPGGRTAQRLSRALSGSGLARYHRRRGRIVLLDRSVYDCLLPGSQDDSLGGRVVQRAMLATSPVPDLAVFLDVPGEVMYARKGEHSPEVLEQRRHGYRTLAATVPGAVLLDGTEGRAALLRRTAVLVWRAHVRALLCSGPRR